MAGLDGKRILLIVGGGIAAYKALETVRLLTGEGATTRAVLTRAGTKFVTELSLAYLTGSKVNTDLFDVASEIETDHIRLSREADLIVVAPATADLMAKMANGHADDLASTVLLATDKPVLIAPAMNVRMWEHAATRRNLARLEADGVHVVGPGVGELADGETGPGRLAEPDEIVEAITRLIGNAARPLDGMTALVTAGPTHEPIDPVRYLANRSSGKQGYAIAKALAMAGARTTLIAGPTTLADPPGVNTVHVVTAAQMLEATKLALPVDVAVFAAAVADWRVDASADEKIKKKGKTIPSLKLVENPDVLATIAAKRRGRPRLVIGFAAETEKVVDHARAKLKSKRADLILANDVSPETGVMGGDRNHIHLISAAGVEDWPEMTKRQVAARLADHIARLLSLDAK